jgi:hypothetical protein
MKNFKFILTLILSVFFLQSYAQKPQFNLSEYKLPELKRHSLETSLVLSGNNSYYQIPSNFGNDPNKSNSNSYYSNFALDYISYLNSLTKQIEINSSIKLNSSYRNQKKDNNLIYEDYDIIPRLNYSIVYRNYFDSKYFFETDISSSYIFERDYNSNNSNNSNYLENGKEHMLIAYFPIKFGKGRIEEVQDARHALYIFDELFKQGRVSKNLSNEDVIAFAKLISGLKNKRFFDARIRKIYEIESIDSFLISNNFTSKADARYFTTINDFWNYGSEPIRRSGTRYSAGIYPGYHFNDYNRSSTTNLNSSYRFYALLLNGGFELTHEKPINNYWQKSIELNCSGGTIIGELNSSDNKISIPNIQFSFKQFFGFYPNTRTAITYSYGVKYVQLFGNSVIGSNNGGSEALGVKFMSDLGINYYISSQVRLRLSSSLYYAYHDSGNYFNINQNIIGNNLLLALLTNNNYINFRANEFANNFQITLTYSIF